MPRVQVKVTKKDITNGVLGYGEQCPIALALKRVGFQEQTVDQDLIAYDFNYYSVVDDAYDVALVGAISTPHKAVKFIERFDNYEPVDPFEFVLRVPKAIAKFLKKSAIVKPSVKAKKKK
jgi:hypothetical protein